MSRVENILKQADMESVRTPSELRAWVNTKTIQLSQTEEGKKYARSGASLPKKLWEEVRPLSLFALQRYGSRADVKCTPNLGNENFDGRIDFEDPNTQSIYVEITYAKDGYDENLRFEVMNQEGAVNLWGCTLVSGTKAAGNRKVYVADDPEESRVDHNKIRQCALEIVRERLVAKDSKIYGINYELVVVIDDHLPFRTGEDQRVLEKYARSVICGANLDFRNIFLLGSSGSYFSQIHGNI